MKRKIKSTFLLCGFLISLKVPIFLTDSFSGFLVITIQKTPAITVFSLDTEPYYNISSNEFVIQNKQTTSPNSTHYSAAQYWHQETPHGAQPPPHSNIQNKNLLCVLSDWIPFL